MGVNEDLVELVREREAIWNVHSEGYKHSCTLRLLWNEIAENLGVDVDAAKTRWRTIRDRFTKECRKESGRILEPQTKWPLLPYLEFLKPQLTPRQTTIKAGSHTELEIAETAVAYEVEIDSDSPKSTENGDEEYKKESFNEHLIELVRERESLWNRFMVEGRQPKTSIRLWQEIADKLGVDVEYAKTRWRTLRDRYTKETKKGKTDQSTEDSRWEFLPMLAFLNSNNYKRPKPTEESPPAPTLLELPPEAGSAVACDVEIHSDSTNLTAEYQGTVRPLRRLLPKPEPSSSVPTKRKICDSCACDPVGSSPSWSSVTPNNSIKRERSDPTNDPLGSTPPWPTVLLKNSSEIERSDSPSDSRIPSNETTSLPEYSTDELFFLSMAREVSRLPEESRWTVRDGLMQLVRKEVSRVVQERKAKVVHRNPVPGFVFIKVHPASHK